MLDFIGGMLDLVDLLFWLPRSLWRLWKWLTEERALPHQLAAQRPEMMTVRTVSQIALGAWLICSLIAAIRWFDAWGETWISFFTGLALFAVGPILLVFLTGRWRDRIVRGVNR
jgi:hypothetical protein